MGTFEWIITGFTILVSVAGTACAVIVPVLLLGVFVFFIYKRNQQSTAQPFVRRRKIGKAQQE